MFRRLSPHPSSAAQGRRLVRDVLAAAGRDDLADVAELLVSEVVTNALVHAGTPVEVRARVGERGLRVEVSDGSPRVPVVRHYASLTATGRGLLLIEELVDRWGVDSLAAGKCVWFELEAVRAGDSSPLERERRVDTTVPGVADPDGTVTVTLVDVPLLLHAAWQIQAESLLREFLLSRIDGDAATAEIQRHAAASDALALLDRQIPPPELPDDPASVMSLAIEPLVSCGRLELTLLGSSVRHFAVLDATLALASELADAGSLLCPPMQPELRMLPRWLCAEVERQARGSVPTAWAGISEGPATPPALPEGWDAETVSAARGPVVAAGDTNVILAVSRSALDLLGYGAPEELVGRRLLDIIPKRHRQAHLAGFTLHLFAGRGPLIGSTVVVPALRRDGAELDVELTLHAETLPSGRKVFLADLAVPSDDPSRATTTLGEPAH